MAYWTPEQLKALQPTEGRFDQIHYPSGYTSSGVKSSATGGYGFLDSTWRQFAGPEIAAQFPRAYMAPPEVQTAVALRTPQSHWTGTDASGRPFNAAAQRIAGGGSAGQGKSAFPGGEGYNPATGTTQLTVSPQEMPPPLFLDKLLDKAGGGQTQGEGEGLGPEAFLDTLLQPPPAAPQAQPEPQISREMTGFRQDSVPQNIIGAAPPLVPVGGTQVAEPQTPEALPQATITSAPAPAAEPQPAPAGPAGFLDNLLTQFSPVGSAQAAERPQASFTTAPSTAPLPGPVQALRGGQAAASVQPEQYLDELLTHSTAEQSPSNYSAIPAIRDVVQPYLAKVTSGEMAREGIEDVNRAFREGDTEALIGAFMPAPAATRLPFGRGRSAPPRVEPTFAPSPAAPAAPAGGPPMSYSGLPAGPAPAAPAAAAGGAGGRVPPAPPTGGGAVPPTPPPAPKPRGKLGRIYDQAIQDAQVKAAPMAAGPAQAQAIAKDFANAERLARYERTRMTDKLNKLSQADRQAMWEAGDAASVAAQRDGVEAGQAIIDALPPAQRDLMMEMERYGADLWERARDAGIVHDKAERLPFYTPRGIVEMEAGAASRPVGRGGATDVNRTFRNTVTKGTNKRTYETAAETEAAAKARFGEGAEIVRDIRTTPMALERFERAINTRNLINEIKSVGDVLGTDLVTHEPGPRHFTVNNPAFQETKVRFTTNAEGKTVPLLDETGNMIFDRKPIYVAKEWDPLRAVLQSGADGILYRGAMKVKGGIMSLIMNSPLIHNMVEWGRALPAMKGKAFTFKTYRTGNKVIKRPDLMREAINDGLVPIGGRGYTQDITGIAEEPIMQPGRSMTAKTLGAITDVISPAAGQKVRAGIDAAGNFWHNTLLWDRIAELQAGLWNDIKLDMIRQGLDRQTAGRVAAHMANRYAGALPNEAMSQMARKFLNLGLFSRSFTMGNLGVMKDLINGLPQDVRAQIMRDAGEITTKSATSISRRKAQSMFLMDIALFYGTGALLTSGLEATRDMMDKEGGNFWGDIGEEAAKLGRGYVDRAIRLANQAREHPLSVLNPFHDMEALSPTSENEPGKADRVQIGYAEDGTAIYANVPVGRVGGDFVGWLTKPLQTLQNKTGFIARPIWNLIANDRESVYNPNPQTIGDTAQNAGRIAYEFVRSMIPETQVKAALNLMGDNPHQRAVNLGQVISPMFGMTISRGYPGGEARGQAAEVARQHESQIRQVLPKVRDLVQRGQEDEARQILRDLGMKGIQSGAIVRGYRDPSRIPKGVRRGFEKWATPEQSENMRRFKEQKERATRPGVP